MECSQAIAEAVKLCKVKVIPAFPITPQTHIVERIADFVNDGKIDADLIEVESEHSAMSAAIGASAVGVRTFTATASQGLALMHEVLFAASGLRLPIVMAVANRALSAPISIWNDHQDSIASRDSGWIQLYVESSQEAYDTIIQAYKIAEDKKVQLPLMVCLDGFILSHVWEPVEFISNLGSFLPEFKLENKLDSKKPVSMGAIAFPNSYMEIKKLQVDAIDNSREIIKKVNLEFNKKFGRKYGDGLIETYKMKNAKKGIIAMGSVCGTIRTVIDETEDVGLIKIRSFRPFPIKELQNLCKGIKEIKVLDKDISPGSNGALYTEVRDALYNSKINIKSFIVGLGGKDVTKSHIRKALKSEKGGWLF